MRAHEFPQTALCARLHVVPRRASSSAVWVADSSTDAASPQRDPHKGRGLAEVLRRVESRHFGMYSLLGAWLVDGGSDAPAVVVQATVEGGDQQAPAAAVVASINSTGFTASSTAVTSKPLYVGWPQLVIRWAHQPMRGMVLRCVCTGGSCL